MTRVGSEYAQALFDLARDEGLSERILKEMELVDETAGCSSEFLRILSAPNISKQEKCGILDNCFRGKVHPYVLNFMKLLAEKGYARSLSECCKTYRELYNDFNGILAVKAVTAVPMTEEQKKRLQAKLESMTGKRVMLSPVVDAAILGGVRLDYDGTRVDDTVRHRLDTVRSMLVNATL
ncbi:MAG: ATP synthase F1 subunit delta [Clostridia bacterium]|jgi:F-type H+-transporting ATPase subunit delta|nr:ATP synthase F1 subunit delta [Clostridia bacterium]